MTRRSKMQEIRIYSREDIKNTVASELKNSLDFIYAELDKLRERINDLDQMFKSMFKYEETK